MTVRTLSQLFEDLKAHIQTPEVSIQTLLEAFHERGFGFFLFMIALPAALPIPALGISTIIALPLLILTAQQAILQGLLGQKVNLLILEKAQSLTLSHFEDSEFYDKLVSNLDQMILNLDTEDFFKKGYIALAKEIEESDLFDFK